MPSFEILISSVETVQNVVIRFRCLAKLYDRRVLCLRLFQVNSSPYEDGWIIKVEVSDANEVKSLMEANDYSKFCEEEDAKH